MLTDDIRDKLRKLNALAEGAGTPEEAAAARGRMARLCFKFGVTMDDVELEEPLVDDEEIVHEDDPLFVQAKVMSWKWRLAEGIAVVNGVFLYQQQVPYKVFDPNRGYYRYKRKGALMMVGKPTGVRMTRYLFQMLLNDIERLAKVYCRGKSRNWGGNWRHGCVDTVAKKVKEAYGEAIKELQAEGGGKALIRLQDAMVTLKDAERFARARMNLTKGTSGGVSAEAEARAAGRAAGHGIKVSGGTAISAGRRQLTG
jgi:hypothetical protein